MGDFLFESLAVPHLFHLWGLTNSEKYVKYLTVSDLLHFCYVIFIFRNTYDTKKKGYCNMKKAGLIAKAALMVLFTMISTTCAFADTSKINGHLDSIVGDAIAGWVWDSSEPETAQTVTVTVTNNSTGETVKTLTAKADEYREDLSARGIGTGSYGFHAGLDWDSLPDAVYTVSISAKETAIEKKLQHIVGTPVSGYKNLVPLGSFRTTAYCPCNRCSEGWGRHTSSGAVATARHTVAVDPRVIPIGSRLLINGIEYVAEDTGGGVKGNHIDIFYNTHAEARQHGSVRAEVYLIQK